MFVVKIKHLDEFLYFSKLHTFTAQRKEARKFTETAANEWKRRLISRGYDARTEMILFFGGENKCH